ncbi:uncharacterized protein LTR77_007829 [Saxophila tyrrhenica]|uniref:Sphingoid long-chain base transporter RSB1 n=1 Tax=Saxophila tyrrhenica TaxID=1690608 RepID=A0AAV9P376_9PEZI|nr:hypothetical protein LTR77_007829 [Saxophila tyrrhenica]
MDVSGYAHLLPRLDPNANCTLSTCPVEASVYGYRPHLSATLVFLILFALSTLASLYQGARLRHTWFFTAAMLLGSLSETIGYIAKILLYLDPFSDTGFKMSVVMLTFAPAFYAAGIYYCLKHICLTFGSSFSRLQPRFYTWIFISCDCFSIMLQAVGGGIASAGADVAMVDIGTDVMIAGLSTQVVTMFCFGVLAADYGLAAYRNRDNLNPATASFRKTRQFQLFVLALWVAYFGILIRCCYRVAELVGGWRENPILRDEGLFIALDSVPCALAALVLNIWHPGFCFPRETQKGVALSESETSSTEEARIGEKV